MDAHEKGIGRPTPFNRWNDRCGSNSAVSGFLRHGCFTPETGHWLARLARPKSANSGHRFAIYSITSSASSRNASGIDSPNALAVLRLTRSANVVGCTTGKSAGFSPRRMRAT
jgi:hypothetical protein